MQGAEAPAHHDPSKEATDFVATNKSLRCCFVCRLVKSERQVGKVTIVQIDGRV